MTVIPNNLLYRRGASIIYVRVLLSTAPARALHVEKWHHSFRSGYEMCVFFVCVYTWTLCMGVCVHEVCACA